MTSRADPRRDFPEIADWSRYTQQQKIASELRLDREILVKAKNEKNEKNEKIIDNSLWSHIKKGKRPIDQTHLQALLEYFRLHTPPYCETIDIFLHGKAEFERRLYAIGYGRLGEIGNFSRWFSWIDNFPLSNEPVELLRIERHRDDRSRSPSRSGGINVPWRIVEGVDSPQFRIGDEMVLRLSLRRRSFVIILNRSEDTREAVCLAPSVLASAELSPSPQGDARLPNREITVLGKKYDTYGIHGPAGRYDIIAVVIDMETGEPPELPWPEPTDQFHSLDGRDAAMLRNLAYGLGKERVSIRRMSYRVVPRRQEAVAMGLPGND